MGSGFSVALRENNLTSPVLSRLEHNCFFFYARKWITKSQISDLNAYVNPFYIQVPVIE